MFLDHPSDVHKVRAELQTRIDEAERKIGELNHAISQTRAILVILAQRDVKAETGKSNGSMREATPRMLGDAELEQMTIQDLTAVRDRIDVVIRQKGGRRGSR